MKSNVTLRTAQPGHFLDDIDSRLQALSFRMAMASYQQLLGQSFEDMVTINEEIAEVMLDSNNAQLVNKWLTEVDDPETRRRLELLAKQFAQALVDNNQELYKRLVPLQKKIVEFQPTLNGKPISRGEKDKILESEPDRDRRRAAYMAGKELDDLIESDLLDLMAERNKLAKKRGYSDYVEMGYAFQDLKETELRELFESIRTQTQDSWNGILDDIKQKLNVSDVQPWDFGYYQNSVVPAPEDSLFPKENIVDTFREVLAYCGGDLNSLPIQVVIQDIPYGGLCIPIKYGEDIRILSNPRDGFQGYDVLFHEFGHGIQSSLLDNRSFVVTSGDPAFFWEGIAGIYEHLMQSETILKKFFSLNDQSIEQIQNNCRLFRMRWFRSIAMACHVEWDAYRGEKDMRGSLQRHHRYFMGFDLPENTGWAGNTLYTTHPLYNQNYIMMDVMSLQTIRAFKKQFGSFPQAGLFEFVNEKYIKAAGWTPWREKIFAATGTSLSADALGSYLKGDPV